MVLFITKYGYPRKTKIEGDGLKHCFYQPRPRLGCPPPNYPPPNPQKPACEIRAPNGAADIIGRSDGGSAGDPL
jgi:hypothetical protein